MTEIYNVYEARTHLSQLMERAAAGEAIILAKAGKPMVELTPIKPRRKNKKKFKRTPGLLRGQMKMAPDFDDEDPEILKMFGIED